MDIFIIIFLTLLSGVFSMTEIAVVSSRRFRLEARAEEGDKGAKAALQLLANPTQFFSTLQMGNTTVALLNGIVGEGAFGSGLSEWFQRLGLGETLASAMGTTIVVIGVTYITIVFGELVSKRIGQSAPESIACAMSRPVLLLAKIAKPFVHLLAVSTNVVLRLLRIPLEPPKDVTEAEIQAQLEQGLDAGIIEQHEHRMVRNVFMLDERLLTSIMRPRADIEWLDTQLSLEAVVDKALSLGHSRYPVCRGDLNNVIGTIRLNDLLDLKGGALSETPWHKHAQAAVFVPETLSGMELLEQFRAQAIRMAFVVDEYGVVQGLLTPLDMLEAITGELSSDEPHDTWATEQEDGAWLVDGGMPALELKSRLDIDELPDEDKERYNTVAGLMQAVSGSLMQQGEGVDISGWHFEVLTLEGRRIEQVRVSRLPEAAAEQGQSDSI